MYQSLMQVTQLMIFMQGCCFNTCAVTDDITGRFLASWQHSARAGDKIKSKWLMWDTQPGVALMKMDE
ncbi:hypothetical protein [Symbiopectobacterium sp.]|uniref:hypothetical protein n=1 Tax=Symbiopectobacterium sp. TaxID=2952789 RepID=UPI003F684F40